ncbi:MAG: lamin tail domain-containing protein, partial [Chloroflexi bacterium]|nr:lamin tail domain-containing protein [Chloroflexota bacterium]
NPGASPINLSNWKLNAADGSPVINLTGIIAAGGYFLIGSSSNVFNDLTVNQTFSGSMSNEGEVLRLLDPSNTIVDTANSDSGAWPAGVASPTYATMERRGAVADGFFSWSTFAGSVVIAHDRNNNSVNGTPGQSNWGITVTLTSTATATATRTTTPTRTPTRRPTAIPVGRPVINEYLARPGFDWNQDGLVNVFDEFIEIMNYGPVDISMSGWRLDDEENLGSSPFVLPDITLKPGERAVYYGLETNILLSDGGDTVRLLNPEGKIYDSYTYSIAKVEDESTCRLPDGNGSWYKDCTPTPSLANTRAGTVPSMPQGEAFQSPVCNLPDTLPIAFLFAECRGYGANIWRAMFWDAAGWDGERFVPENMSKWMSFVE